MLCGPQTVFLLDSVSTGLDSSTTFDIMNTLKVSATCFCSFFWAWKPCLPFPFLGIRICCFGADLNSRNFSRETTPPSSLFSVAAGSFVFGPTRRRLRRPRWQRNLRQHIVHPKYGVSMVYVASHVWLPLHCQHKWPKSNQR